MKAEVDMGEFNKLVEGIKAKGIEAQKILWDEIQLSTLNIESGAKVRCPVLTGRLRASISSLLDQKSQSAAVYTNVEYASDVEKGTPERKATPYLYPAFNAEMSLLLNGLKVKFNVK